MAIPLAAQRNYAVNQSDFRAQVESALVGIAITSFTAAANPNATIQQKRLVLASQVLNNPEMWLTTVAWVVITRPSFNTVDDINDAAIIAILNQAMFDTLADKLIVLPV